MGYGLGIWDRSLFYDEKLALSVAELKDRILPNLALWGSWRCVSVGKISYVLKFLGEQLTRGRVRCEMVKTPEL